MFDMEFYEDKNGYSETAEWLMELDNKAHNSKEHRVRLKKFVEYIEILKQYGTFIGEPVVKHITGTDLWELRPTRDRVFFVHVLNDKFLILNHFVKKPRKHPTEKSKKQTVC